MPPTTVEPVLYRTLLRARVAARLAKLDAFRFVYNSRIPVLTRARLPCARVYTYNDVRTNRSSVHDIGEFDGVLTLRVQVIVEDPEKDPSTADRLDFYCWLAETALLSDVKIRRDLRHVNSINTAIEYDVSGELRTATATMDMEVQYADCFAPLLEDELKHIRFKLDFIDPPADPNTGPPGTPPNVGPPDGYPGGYPGPDGRIEAEFDIALTDRTP